MFLYAARNISVSPFFFFPFFLSFFFFRALITRFDLFLFPSSFPNPTPRIQVHLIVKRAKKIIIKDIKKAKPKEENKKKERVPEEN